MQQPQQARVEAVPRIHAPLSGRPGLAALPGAAQAPAIDFHLEVRRLRFYVDLLSAGYRRVLDPGAEPGCLRAERLALGIDVPVLDVVPLWASRRDDGAISIPFIDYLLAEVRRILGASFGAPEAPSGVSPDVVRGACALLDWMLDHIGSTDEDRRTPRLEDRYIPENLSRLMCGAPSLLDPVVSHCEAALGFAPLVAH